MPWNQKSPFSLDAQQIRTCIKRINKHFLTDLPNLSTQTHTQLGFL